MTLVSRAAQSSADADRARPVPPAVSVVIVTYRSRGVIDACLASLTEGVTRAREIIIVDNASIDGTVDYVRREWPGVHLIARPANEGFAAACNTAIAAATGRHILLLNPDTQVERGAIDRLVDFLDEHPETGAAAPRLLNPDGSDQGTARAFPTPAAAVLGRKSPLTRWFPGNRWSRRYLSGRQHPGEEPFEIDWVSGACLMAPRRVVDEVGGLDDGFFMYWEDADWCRRIKAAGYEVRCVPAARVTHDEGGVRRGLPPRQVWQFHRSAYRYFAKHHLCGRRAALRPLAFAVLSVRAAALVARHAVPARGAGPVPATATGAPLPGTLGATSVARGVAVSTGSQLVAKAAHLALNIVSSLAIIRSMTPAGYGDYVLILTVTTLAGLLSDLGLNKLAVREVSRDPSSESAVVGTAIAARLGLAVVAAAVVQAALLAMGAGPQVRLAGAVISLLFVGEALLAVVVAFHVRLKQQYEAFVRVAAEAIETALILWLVSRGATLVQIVTAPVVGIAVGTVLAMVLARRRFGVRLRVDASRLRHLIRQALPIAPAMLIGVAYLRLDSLMLAALRPARDVGLYGAAFQPIEYLLLASAVLVNVLFPLLVRARGADRARFTWLYRRGTEAVVAALLPAPILLSVIALPLANTVYGPEFADSAQPMRLLSIALVLLAVSTWQGFVLLAADHQWATLRYNAAALAAAAALNGVLIPRMGYMGAAIATLTCAAGLAAWLTAASHRLAGARLDLARIARLLAAALAMGAVLWGLEWAGTAVPLAAAAAVLAYPALLRVLGAVTPQDLRELRGLDRPAVREAS